MTCFVRYCTRKEHEVERECQLTLPDEVLDVLVMLRDTLLQYELMSIPDDYLRACEGGDHLAREKLRHDVLIKRLDICLPPLNCVESVQPICVMIMNLKGQLSKIGI